MKTLFGTPPEQKPSQQASGFGALPESLQQRFTQLGSAAAPLLTDPSQYFAPQGLSADELTAQRLIQQPTADPAGFRQGIEAYLSPYRGIVTEDINRAFEDPRGALSGRISEAGAFGGSRARGAQSDLERSRLDAIANALNQQYGTALGQRQQGIQNLLGFGGLERGVDLAQRQALPQALQSFSGALSPLLGASTGTGGYTTTGKEGLVSKVGKVAQLAGTIAGFSDIRLKEDVKLVGVEKGHNIYEFNYKDEYKTLMEEYCDYNKGQRFRGVMAHEVEKIKPSAILTHSSGYKMVDYSELGLKMEAVNG